MAHNCPVCSLVCHCSGDIDDMVLNQEKFVASCRCALRDERERDCYDYDEDSDHAE